jgi:type IV secretory pathway VirB2 component (pilin)
MGGIIGTGLSEESNAISGFVRSSAEQQQVDQANQQEADAKKAQTMQMITGGVSAAISIAALIAVCIM